MPENKVLVKCETSEGMFSNEVAVMLQSNDGSKLSLFADEDLIEERNGDSYLIARLAHPANGNNIATILLPSESFETGTRWVDVASNLVMAI
jgi:hypothetical protein